MNEELIDEDVKQERTIKAHLKRNKNAYITGGVCLIVGAIAGAVLINRSSGGAQFAQKITQVGIGYKVRPTIVNFVERSTPSKPVHLVGTDLYFDSLSDAARKTGHSLSMISRNVNGHIADVKGDVFELLESA